MQKTSTYNYQDRPRPETRQVKEDIWKIPMPIPFPLRDVNVYALLGKNGSWALVDAGMGTPDARAAFTAGLSKAGLELDKLEAILLTHHHPDHVGLSAEFSVPRQLPVYMHPIDADSVQVIWSGTMPKRFDAVSRFFQQHGLPATQLWYTQVDQEQMRHIINVPPRDAMTTVEDGDYVELVGERYRVIWTPGHADGHIALFRERDGVFLAGDHVLPRITPNIGLYSRKDRPNPLGDYINSLKKVAPLPATIVLPGHGEPFIDLAGRTAEIITHHEQREMQILTLLEERPQNAAQLADQLFKHRQLKSDEARRMAVAEVLSHLEYLRYKGLVEQHPTNDGIILYAVL